MKDSELSNRVERLATRFVNEDSLLGDRRHDTVVDEVTHELSCGRLVDVRRRHSGCIPILCEEFGFMPLVIGCRVVEYVWIGHMNSRSGTLAGAPRAFRRRQTLLSLARGKLVHSTDEDDPPAREDAIAYLIKPGNKCVDARAHIEQLPLKGYLYDADGRSPLIGAPPPSPGLLALPT